MNVLVAILSITTVAVMSLVSEAVGQRFALFDAESTAPVVRSATIYSFLLNTGTDVVANRENTELIVGIEELVAS